ncbi:HD-GYP domain-containing protein [Ornithinimicrobium tianjinense]|uniref:HD-GYP domain-containing protein n=1 Tax=Ornithinimicrobium tianjinense TaxID=1195761 RepID=A0A917BMH1_9MICO|nr:HD domain-containing phosphohydrolase [Ornithinimicrobium tianjinense]GGF51841.1 hypothetical protein GCM10011366_19640 [Ornithinimicrobium tianjinense]
MILVVLGSVGVNLRERDLGPHLGVSLATVVLAAALPLVGVGAVVVGLVSYALDLRPQRAQTRAFNVSMTACVAALGAVVYLVLGGQRVEDATGGALRLLVGVGAPLLAAYVAMFVANAFLYAVMSRLVRGTRVVTTAWQAVRRLGLAYVSHVVIAFLFAVLWGPAGLGALSALFVLGPLVAAHWSMGREALARREHEETVVTFVAALEEADPGSVGHSARVAELADLLAPHLGFDAREAQDLRYAALLHDIGLVTTRHQLAEDPARDEVAYLTALSVHPEAGARVLAGLDFLTGALPGIAHHHERWDGLGFPSGLSGEEIPLTARVIAVADAFDALTGVPGGLEPAAAVELLRERAGSHLDPEIVDALAAVLPQVVLASSVPGPVTIGLRDQLAPASVAPDGMPDHDHPSVSDAFAAWQPEGVRSP